MSTLATKNLFLKVWLWVCQTPANKPTLHTRKKGNIMTATVKTVKVNYTPEATKAIVEAYKANASKETVAAMAAKFGKTTRSIVAKLSREGVYKKAEYVAKNGEKPETKEHKVDRIAVLLNVPSEKLGGLEAATKTALDLVIAGLTPKTETKATEGATPEGDATEGDATEGNAATA